jgi:thioredoxin 1
MAGSLVELTVANWDDEVVKSDIPVIIDFWAAWCGPCRAIAPIFEELSNQYAGQVKFGKLDVDSHGEIAGRYGIHSIPTLLLFKGGALEDRVIGAVPKAMIEEALKKLL